MMDEQTGIILELGVSSIFDSQEEISRRVKFLKDYLTAAGLHTFVLGISGGVDSLTAGLLAQAAVRQLRNESYNAEFAAVRLPYGLQADESDAQKSLAVIRPDKTYTINIKQPSDAAMEQIRQGGLTFIDTKSDFLLGNIKARQRMIAQFTLASALRGLVIGTDHAAEALMGFFTKFGDGAADILPLAGLNKRRVRALAQALGAPADLVFKVPTADLETSWPLRPDEEVYGVTYDEIDDFLEGKPVSYAARARILSAFTATAHKRALPVAPAVC